jgi:polyisoprenoid-binding protein YceI
LEKFSNDDMTSKAGRIKLFNVKFKCCLNSNKIIFTGLMLILPGISSAVAGNFKIEGCKIYFKTKGAPVLVTIEGKSETACSGDVVVEGADTKKTKITMEVNKLDTGISLRNKHLRENYLHTDKFPTSVLTELDAKDFDAQKAGTAKAKGAFTAQLELHGNKKAIDGTYQIKGGNKFSGEFTIDLPDFGVERPSFMGVKVVDKVLVTFEFNVK